MEIAEIGRCHASVSPPQTHQGGLLLGSIGMAVAVSLPVAPSLTLMTRHSPRYAAEYKELLRKGVATESETSYLFLFISLGRRLEATADADGDIGRSSQLNHSKALDIYF